MRTASLPRPVLMRWKHWGSSHSLFSACWWLPCQMMLQGDAHKSQSRDTAFADPLTCEGPPYDPVQYTHQIASFCFMNYNRPWLTGTRWTKQCLPMSRWMNMAVHGVLEQRWSRSTSDSGLLRQLLMQRWVSAWRHPSKAMFEQVFWISASLLEVNSS